MSERQWSPYGHNSIEDQRRPVILYQNGACRVIDGDEIFEVKLNAGTVINIPNLSRIAP